jgi:hypothetical protein
MRGRPFSTRGWRRFRNICSAECRLRIAEALETVLNSSIVRFGLLLISLLAACSSGTRSGPLLSDSGTNLRSPQACDEAIWPPDRPADGTPIPNNVITAIAGAWSALDLAMIEGNAIAAANAVCEARVELGNFQGVAEIQVVHRPRPATPVLATEVLPDYLAKVEATVLGVEPWTLGGGSIAGAPQTTALRTPCHLVEWYLAVAPLAGARRAALETAAHAGLEWLRAVQTPSGVFPYPDLSDDAEAFLATCLADGGSRSECEGTLPRLYELAWKGKQAWIAAGRPAGVIVNGWFVSDDLSDPGGLQFDNGVCGRALLAGYEAFGDPALLGAARRAGTWAAAQRPVLNFNYNAFSAGLLAELARVDPDAAVHGWATAALAKAQVGVLPGALPDGRWVDAHNARIDYHLIMLAALLRVDAITDDPWLTGVVDASRRRAIDELTRLGAAGTDDGLDAFLLARAAGLDVGDALGVLLNDAYRGRGDVQSGALALWLRATLAD